MKYSVTRLKDLKSCLKELEPFIRNGQALYTGRDLKSIGLRQRELLGNWLVCAVANYKNKNDNLTISSDPTKGDGLICNRKTGKGYKTEHVMALVENNSASSTEDLIIERIEKKKSKGEQYASGKMLIVFLEGGGEWFPSKVSRLLVQPLLFECIWLFSLHGPHQDQYIYDVVELDSNIFQKWKVIISKEFDSWKVVKG